MQVIYSQPNEHYAGEPGWECPTLYKLGPNLFELVRWGSPEGHEVELESKLLDTPGAIAWLRQHGASKFLVSFALRAKGDSRRY